MNNSHIRPFAAFFLSFVLFFTSFAPVSQAQSQSLWDNIFSQFQSIQSIVSRTLDSATETQSASVISAGNFWANQLEPGEWYEIPNSNLSAVDPDPRLPGNPKSKVFAWTSFAINPLTSEVYTVANGGHANYAGNEIDKLDLESNNPRWVNVLPPTPAEQLINGTSHYADGRPTSRHTYYGVTLDPVHNDIMLFGGAHWSRQGGFHYAVDSFDFSNNQWRPAGTHPDLPKKTHLGATVADPNTGDVYVLIRFNVHRWDRSSNTWSIVATHNRLGGASRGSAFDTKRNEILVLGNGSTNDWVRYDLGTKSVTTGEFTGNPDGVSLLQEKNLAVTYVAATDRYYVRSGKVGGAVYQINPDTNEVSVFATAGGADIPEIRFGPFNKFLYAPRLGGFVYVPSHKGNAWFLKLGDGESTQEPSTDTVPPQLSSAGPVGELAAGTDSAILTVSTNETAECRYDESSDVSFSSMNRFSTTNVRTHRTTLSGFSDGNSYSYYIRCQDPAGNTSGRGFTVDFLVGEQFGAENEANEGEDSGLSGEQEDSLATNEENSPLSVGSLAFDGATAHAIGITLEVSGDDDRDAGVMVEYRKRGSSHWNQTLDMFRNRSDASDIYASLIPGLEEDTRYDIRITVSDPDGVFGDASQAITERTKEIPQRVSASGADRVVEVSNVTELTAALNDAEPGDLILLAAGMYDQDFTIKRKYGTNNKPIVIRGAPDHKSIIDGKFKVATADFIHVEDLVVQNTREGIELRDWVRDEGTVGLVVRNNVIRDVDIGIKAKPNGQGESGHSDLYIVDNLIEGRNQFNDLSMATWGDEGIVVGGQYIEVAYNTLSGFGDSLGLIRPGSMPNRVIDIHHNHVLYGADDGVELDFSTRNTQAHHNLITNSANGISFQMVYDGPAYAYQNVMYNLARGPYKIKPEAQCNDGVFLYNNTALNAHRAWRNHSACGKDVTVVNNLFTGDTTHKNVIGADTSKWKYLNWSNNAFIYDGMFQLHQIWQRDFERWSAEGSVGENDVLLSGEKVFDEHTVPFAPQIGLGSMRTPRSHDFTLDRNSSAVDAAKVLPSINDNYTGRGPDIGAHERGHRTPQYGVRSAEVLQLSNNSRGEIGQAVDDGGRSSSEQGDDEFETGSGDNQSEENNDNRDDDSDAPRKRGNSSDSVAGPTVTQGGSSKFSYRFSDSDRASVGSRGLGVRWLQRALNRLGYTVSNDGPGSTGNETDYFGPATEAALKRFQSDNGIVSSGTVSSTGYGAFGPSTRATLNKRLEEVPEEEPASAPQNNSLSDDERAAILGQIRQILALIAILQTQLEARSR